MSQYVLIFIGFLLFLGFLKSFFTVKQQTAAIMERFGRFHSIRTSGLQLKIPFVDKTAFNRFYAKNRFSA